MISSEEHQHTKTTGTLVTHPIQFVQVGNRQDVPAPLARVSTCGMMQIEVLKEVVSRNPPLGRYECLPVQTLHGRGAIPSLMLLKLLVGRPHRFATKDWLSTALQGEMEQGALVRVDTTSTYLRKLLYGLPEHDETNPLHLLLVAHLRNGRSSGPGYQLAPYPLLWMDTDALFSHAEHAALLERMGEPDLALSFWERAYALARRGSYLPDEPTSDWAEERRSEVQGARRQSVHLSIGFHLPHMERQAKRKLSHSCVPTGKGREPMKTPCDL